MDYQLQILFFYPLAISKPGSLCTAGHFSDFCSWTSGRTAVISAEAPLSFLSDTTPWHIFLLIYMVHPQPDQHITLFKLNTLNQGRADYSPRLDLTYQLFVYDLWAKMVFTYFSSWKNKKKNHYFLAWENEIKFKSQWTQIKLYWDTATPFIHVKPTAALRPQ